MNRLKPESDLSKDAQAKEELKKKKNFFRMVTYGGKEKNELWKRNFHVKHTSMMMNIAVIDMFKEKAKERKISLTPNKPSKWSFSKLRGEYSHSETFSQKFPDLQGVYNLKYNLIEKSVPAFIYRKEKKRKETTQQSVSMVSPSPSEKRAKLKYHVPNFGKMKSRKALVEAKDYRLIDLDELEDQRIAREIQNDQSLHLVPQDSNRR